MNKGRAILRSMIGASIALLLLPASVLNADDDPLALTVTIVDDFDYPQVSDYDYGLAAEDIGFTNDRPAPGEAVTITATVHNLGVCRADGAWGWYSSSGRSCWAEWDFEYEDPTRALADISFRCRDKDATVRWRVELDGAFITDISVPPTATNQSWNLVTIHDVPVTPGPHTLFLGTYQMDYYPDYSLDWVEIGEVRVEAERYDRMGGS